MTAERENGTLALHVTTCWNNSLEARLKQAEAERDAMREVCEAADGMRDCQMVVGSQCDHMRRLNSALARLDATRKATADATEGK